MHTIIHLRKSFFKLNKQSSIIHDKKYYVNTIRGNHNKRYDTTKERKQMNHLKNLRLLQDIHKNL